MWNKNQIQKHKAACEVLKKVKNLTLDYIKQNKNVSEYEVQQFILRQFKIYKVKSDKDPPIVAFGKSSDRPHYFCSRKSKMLRKGDLILIDIWTKLREKDAPFSDITWMAYNGRKIPKNIRYVFDIVRAARDASIKFIKS